MILGTSEILARLRGGQIFRPKTWIEDNVKEASYALRVDGDGMIIGDSIIEPGAENARSEIKIQPGRIAILSTMERLCMPSDLVGRLGVRLEFASKGLVGQMGMQVDPFYGQGADTEVRLYIKVANLGNNDVVIRRKDAVFNIEFSRVNGAERQGTKNDTWKRLMETVGDSSHRDWTYLTQINENLDAKAGEIKDDMTMRLGWVRDNQQAVVMFGVFLVAITILAAMVGVIINVDNAPTWVADWGWIFLILLCAGAVTAIALFLFFVGRVAWRIANRE